MIQGALNPKQLKELKAFFNRLDMPPPKRQRLLWRIAKHGLIVVAKRHVRENKTPDGQAWPGRKTKFKRPLLRNLPKLIKIKEMPEIEAVRLYFSGGGYRNGQKTVPAGVVAYAQQHGMKATINKASVKGNTNDGQPTKKQIRKLRALGFKYQRSGKWIKASSAYITENLTYSRAGLLIRKLQKKELVDSWEIDVPSREFLGVSDNEFNDILARQLQAIEYGWRVRAQDINGSNG